MIDKRKIVMYDEATNISKEQREVVKNIFKQITKKIICIGCEDVIEVPIMSRKNYCDSCCLKRKKSGANHSAIVRLIISLHKEKGK